MSITVDTPVRHAFAGWNIGDSIVIPTTDFAAQGSHKDQTEVTSTSSSRCLHVHLLELTKLLS